MAIDLNKHYRVSEDVITREIEGELVIVPLESGLGNLNAEMYSLSVTGIAVWDKLDGVLSLDEIIKNLSEQYSTPYDEIREDVVDLMEAFLERGLVVES